MATSFQRIEYPAGTLRGFRHLASGAFVPVDDYAVAAEIADGDQPQAAAPPPVRYSGSLQVDQRVRTTNAAATEIWRATLAQVTLYRARLELLGVDAGNGNARYIEARIVAKRLSNGALMVGAPAILANLQDAGASTWAVNASVSGNDFVVTVAGQAGRNIDWHLSGDVVSFTPGGAS